jgi:hypothetical protein
VGLQNARSYTIDLGPAPAHATEGNLFEGLTCRCITIGALPSGSPALKIRLGTAGPFMPVDQGMKLRAEGSGVINEVSFLWTALGGSGKTFTFYASQGVEVEYPPAVQLASGAAVDVTDRAARAVGKVGIQVAAADVSASNPVYTRIGRKNTWRVPFSVVVGGAGVFAEVKTSATKTVRIAEVFMDKPSVAVNFTMSRRSTFGTGGASTEAQDGAVSTAQGARTCSVKLYTTPPVGGAALITDVSPAVQHGVGEKEAFTFGDQEGERPILPAGAGTETFTVSIDGAATVKGHIELTEE